MLFWRTTAILKGQGTPAPVPSLFKVNLYAVTAVIFSCLQAIFQNNYAACKHQKRKINENKLAERCLPADWLTEITWLVPSINVVVNVESKWHLSPGLNRIWDQDRITFGTQSKVHLSQKPKSVKNWQNALNLGKVCVCVCLCVSVWAHLCAFQGLTCALTQRFGIFCVSSHSQNAFC